jgi:hypothetical protein
MKSIFSSKLNHLIYDFVGLVYFTIVFLHNLYQLLINKGLKFVQLD